MASGPDVAVFICYRDFDSADDAGRLHRLLSERLDPTRVWLGIDAVPRDEDYGEAVDDAIGRADVVLVVIGPDWLKVDAGGRRLLDDPADPVRLEIEAALARDVPLIPTFVGGARAPRSDELPKPLRPLLRRDAIELREDAFEADVERLEALVTELGRSKAAAAAELERQSAAAAAAELERQSAAAVAVPAELEAPTSPAAAERPVQVDENVQFTVYRPRTLQPGQWSTLLAFAHLSERRSDGDADEPDPLEEVKRQAEQVLGQDVGSYLDLRQDSSAGVPREGEILFLPTADGIVFNPPSRTFRWFEPVHREEFRLRTGEAPSDEPLRGRLSVFLGVRLLAEISLQFMVAEVPSPTKPAPVVEQANPYHRIFASYSHRDVHIAEQFEHYAAAVGDRYLRDWVDLRAGENWSERLEELIRQADVFQLFWSSNSMRSANVRREWEYALSLSRPNFVRPTYWEVPMPRDPMSGLPPPALMALHFHRLAVDAVAPPAAIAPAPVLVDRFPDRDSVGASPMSAPAGRGRLPLVVLVIIVAVTLLAFVAAPLFVGSPPR
jgi:hypothetical protein